VARRRLPDPHEEIASLRALESDDAANRVEQVLRRAGFGPLTDLRLCARAGVELDAIAAIYDRLKRDHRWVPVAGTDAHVAPAALDDLKFRFVRWLQRYHKKNPDSPGRQADSVLGWLERITSRALARPLLDRWLDDGTVKRLGRYVCLPAFAPQLSTADEKILAALVTELRTGGFQPPLLDAVKSAASADRKRLERLATLATALGELVHLGDNLYLHVEAERDLRETVASLIGRTGPATVAQVREALNSSRKYVVPFLEYLDRIGFTKRVGDTRVLTTRDQE
jgi:selenocysteine-specific elongation factor